MRSVLIPRRETTDSWVYISNRLRSLGHDVDLLTGPEVAVEQLADDADAILIDFDIDEPAALALTGAINQDQRFGWSLIIGVAEGDSEALGELAEQGIIDGLLFPLGNERLMATQLAILQKRLVQNRERREMVSTVSGHESRLEALFETSPDALVTCVADGTITHANRAASEMFGCSKDELCQMNIEQLMPERFRADHVSHRQQFFAAPCSRRLGSGLDLFGLRHDAEEFPIDIALGWHDGDGQLCATAALRDMTEQRNIEYHLRKSKERLEQAYSRLSADLQSASQIQQSFLPTRFPKVKNVRFAWVYEACEFLAGDAIDIFQLDEEHLGFYLVDVSGHGTTAALLSVTLSNLMSPSLASSTILRVPFGNRDGFHLVSPINVVRELNDEFLGRLPREHFFTMLYGILNTRSLALQFVSAGHPSFLLQQAGRTPEIQSHSGLPVALVPNAAWDEHTLQLEPNTRLCFLSDGILESANEDRELLGIRGAADLLSISWDDDIEDTVGRIRDHAVHRNPRGLRDDISIIAIEITEP